ncbi:MAG: VapC toxin family PIN domain ribonuclease [Deltaproteobacteria bacterium CG_4_8_14_3_um_filter_45_9]|nr:MAG: VapC toxin family PIN domain ribonuclease [Deltaproteobacteria bacterium CG03_land_8_20_14_0_80_45_14]PIX25273.1 MAG: VapC toxin family PIN domain ribonuclease [Deltaproteobacteria bacterium CG_4_8_14_3_um_filter_45_9]
MIAVDSNLLVYAHREDSPWHNAAYARIVELAEGPAAWAIPWPCIHEFLSIVTHPRIYTPPTPLEKAIDQVEAWLESPNLVLLSESEDYWPQLRSILQTGRVSGPQVHDARVAALCQQHGVSELWTIDRDFNRFPGLTVRNPLVD